MSEIDLKSMLTFTAKSAKNNFGEMLSHVAKNQPVSLTRHGKPAAYLVPAELFERVVALRNEAPGSLQGLRAEFDSMFEQMQTSHNVAVGRSLFEMSEREIHHKLRPASKAKPRRTARRA